MPAYVMLMSLVVLVLGCRDLLPKEELKEDKTKIKSYDKRIYIPPMVIVVGLLCFIMYAA